MQPPTIPEKTDPTIVERGILLVAIFEQSRPDPDQEKFGASRADVQERLASRYNIEMDDKAYDRHRFHLRSKSAAKLVKPATLPRSYQLSAHGIDELLKGSFGDKARVAFLRSLERDELRAIIDRELGIKASKLILETQTVKEILRGKYGYDLLEGLKDFFHGLGLKNIDEGHLARPDILHLKDLLRDDEILRRLYCSNRMPIDAVIHGVFGERIYKFFFGEMDALMESVYRAGGQLLAWEKGRTSGLLVNKGYLRVEEKTNALCATSKIFPRPDILQLHMEMTLPVVMWAYKAGIGPAVGDVPAPPTHLSLAVETGLVTITMPRTKEGYIDMTNPAAGILDVTPYSKMDPDFESLRGVHDTCEVIASFLTHFYEPPKEEAPKKKEKAKPRRKKASASRRGDYRRPNRWGFASLKGNAYASMDYRGPKTASDGKWWPIKKEDLVKVCSQCGVQAEGIEAKDVVFGRRKGTLVFEGKSEPIFYLQSSCRKCRGAKPLPKQQDLLSAIKCAPVA